MCTVLVLVFSFNSMLICFKVSVSMSVSRGSGDPVIGFCSMWRMSLVALAIISDDDAVGMGVCMGGQLVYWLFFPVLFQ